MLGDNSFQQINTLPKLTAMSSRDDHALTDNRARTVKLARVLQLDNPGPRVLDCLNAADNALLIHVALETWWQSTGRVQQCLSFWLCNLFRLTAQIGQFRFDILFLLATPKTRLGCFVTVALKE